jgi:hypothetical protein
MFVLIELCVFCVIHFIHDCLLHKKILLIYSEIYIFALPWPMLYICICMCINLENSIILDSFFTE